MMNIKMNKGTWILLGVLLILLCCSIIYFYMKVSRYDHWQIENQHRDAAVVLGASLWHNKPSPALRERLNRALDLYRKGNIDTFILSGGLGNNEQQSEAQ